MVAPSAQAHAQVDLHCLTRQDVLCRACAESCEPAAITFQVEVGGVPRPKIDPTLCTGCGECLSSCPVQAIYLQKRVTKGEST